MLLLQGIKKEHPHSLVPSILLHTLGKYEPKDIETELFEIGERAEAEHPSWGFRRVWAWLRRRGELPVNRKRVLRLMRENGLLVAPRGKLRAVRKNTSEKMRRRHPVAMIA